MVFYRIARGVIVIILLALVAAPISTGASTSTLTNIIGNPSFENNGSTAWFVLSNYGNGSVSLPSIVRSHNGTLSAQLSAINRTQNCATSECKDSVRAIVEQFLPGTGPTLNNLSNSNQSFSAWWYVASSTLPAYSLHFQLQFSDGSTIEYSYGQNDLSNSTGHAVFKLGPIPARDSWFKMQRDLSKDIRSVVSNPGFTRVTSVWFGAFGGTFNSVAEGETAWVDDAALYFDIPPSVPIAAFDANPNSGTAPLTIQFNASSSHESSGFSGSIIVFMWNFGDGSPAENASDPVTTHTFSNPVTYTVTLTVFDANQHWSSPSSTVVRVESVLEGLALPVTIGGILGLLVAVIIIRRRRHSENEDRKSRPRPGRK